MFHQCANSGRREAFRASLPDEHVLATMMDEHVVILERLDRLEELAGRLDSIPPRAVLEEVRAIGHALVEAEPHHEREEKVLFPALVERGVLGPPACMEAEHVELRALKRGVEELARQELEGVNTHAALQATAYHLVSMLRDHIAKEDNVLYPMAAQKIADPAVWADFKARCDAIGYCCTPSRA